MRRGNAVALATLVRVEGSSYRRTGARLLIAANGDYAGSISGGCLEAEVIRKAQWLIRNGPVVERYSTLFDDTAEIPYGLGCGGTVDLLIEPTGTPEFCALMEAMEASLCNESSHVETQLPTAQRSMSRSIESCAHGTLPRVIDDESFFAEVFDPPQRLFVFGAGDDAQQVVRLAAEMGWSVIVLDGRRQLATAARFPEAERVAVTFTAGDDDLTPRDAAIVMTHSYLQDRDWLTAILPHGLRYVGLLGARHRSALLICEVAERLGWDIDRTAAGIFAPVGLDLGGDGAEAIALAAVAEIQACVAGKLGASRRMTAATIEEQIKLGGASRYRQAQCAL